jgi:hypothetical protein
MQTVKVGNASLTSTPGSKISVGTATIGNRNKIICDVHVQAMWWLGTWGLDISTAIFTNFRSSFENLPQY